MCCKNLPNLPPILPSGIHLVKKSISLSIDAFYTFHNTYNKTFLCPTSVEYNRINPYSFIIFMVSIPNELFIFKK